VVKLGAVAAILFIDPQFSIDLQLIGGVIILQTLPAVALGLYTRWLHRGALIAGWDGAPEVLLEPADGLLVPDGDGGLGAAARAARAADRHPLRRAVRVGRVDGRHPVVAALRRRAPAARHRARRADGRAGDRRYFRKMGVLPAAPDSIAAALAAGHDVALWPGGEIDSLRPWTKRDEAILAGRKGFVRMAIKAGVPIVPIATVGGPDSMPVLATRPRLAKALQLDKVARLKMFPIALRRRGASPRRCCPRSRCRRRSAPPSRSRSSSTRTPSAPRTTTTSTRKYDEVQAASSTGWTRWRGAAAAAVRLSFERISGRALEPDLRVTDAAGHAGRCAARRSASGSARPTTWAASTASSPPSRTPTCPVPPVVGLCEDESVNGAPFYVMEFVDGPILRSSRGGEQFDEDERRAIGERVVDTLVAIHAVDPDAVGLGELGPQGGLRRPPAARWHGPVGEVEDPRAARGRRGPRAPLRPASPSRARRRSSTATTASTT
jgi:hypothetical protein